MDRCCDHCGAPYRAQRSTSRFCSGACRTAAGRRPRKAAPVVTIEAPRPPAGDIEAATLRELTAAGVEHSAAGARALAMARLIDSPAPGTFGAIAGWSREHSAALAEALRTDQVVQSTSLADQLKARRDARRGA